MLAAIFAEAPPICPKEDDADEGGAELKLPMENWAD